MTRRFAEWLAVAVLAAVIAWIAEGSRLELAWLDQQQHWLSQARQPFPIEDVVVVGLDDASLKSFGVPVATLHRQLGQFLGALAKAEPRAVGLDVVLPEDSYDRIQPGLDAALARGMVALKQQGIPLVLGLGADASGRMRQPHPLFSNLAGSDGSGAAFVRRDSDGRVPALCEVVCQRPPPSRGL